MAKTAGKRKTQTKSKETPKPRGKSAPWLEKEGLMRIEGWAMDGCTDQEIAKNMGVAYSTLRVWRDSFPAISAALKRARDVADRQVEHRLFDMTQGYTVEVKKVFKVKKEHYDEKGRKIVTEELQSAVEELHIPANVTAQIFWMKNRKPEKWREKPDTSREDSELPDDGLKEQMEAAASKVCAGTDDSDILPEDEGDGKDENA